MILFKGYTAAGKLVVVTGEEDWRHVKIAVEGDDVDVMSAALFRDGGTRRYVTSGGTLVFPNRLGKPEVPRLDGDPITEIK